MVCVVLGGVCRREAFLLISHHLKQASHFVLIGAFLMWSVDCFMSGGGCRVFPDNLTEIGHRTERKAHCPKLQRHECVDNDTSVSRRFLVSNYWAAAKTVWTRVSLGTKNRVWLRFQTAHFHRWVIFCPVQPQSDHFISCAEKFVKHRNAQDLFKAFRASTSKQSIRI